MASVAAVIQRVAEQAKMNATTSVAAPSACKTEDNSAGTYATETTDIGDAGLDDVTLPDPFDSSDAIYIGYSATFASLQLYTSTAGAGDDVAGETVWEYYNGAFWVSLPVITDGTAALTTSGIQTVAFSVPTDWASATVDSAAAYYVRLRATASDVYNTTQPIIAWAAVRVSTADRLRILGYVQEAADDLCLDAEIRVPAQASVALTAGDHTYTLGSSPFNLENLLELSAIHVTDSAVTGQEVAQVSMGELMRQRNGAQANATPTVYAVNYPQILFHPAPASGTTLTVDYVQSAPVLADNADEITFVPPPFHYNCLANKAIYHALAYKGQRNAAEFLAMYDQSIRRLKKFKARSGGIQRASSGGRPVALGTSQDPGAFA